MVEQKGTGNKTKQKGLGADYEFNPKDFFKSFVGVAQTVFTKPSDFYQNMPTTRGFLPPFIFVVVCVGVCVVLGGSLAALLGSASDNLVWAIFKFFIVLVIFSFIGAGILHYIAQQFFEGKAAYEGTYRVVAYAGVIYLVTWIPVVGVFAFLYGLYLQIVGLEKVHQITTGQAVVTVLIALAVYLIAAFLSVMPFPGMRF
jgi:hypothetical protein